MQTGATQEERRQQRDILKALYADYDAKRHDVFVIRYNREQEERALQNFMRRRGIK